jgi:hypothetical protein
MTVGRRTFGRSDISREPVEQRPELRGPPERGRREARRLCSETRADALLCRGRGNIRRRLRPQRDFIPRITLPVLAGRGGRPMMGSIGVPELVLVLFVLFVLATPVILTVLLLVWAYRRVKGVDGAQEDIRRRLSAIEETLRTRPR